jgi:hypothetical protein
LRRAQRIAFILGFQTRDDLSGLDAIPELAIVFEHTAGDAECKRDFVFRFDSAGQGDRGAGCALFNRYGTHRTRLWRRAVYLW